MSTRVVYVYTVHCTVYRRRISFSGKVNVTDEVALCRPLQTSANRRCSAIHIHTKDRLTRANKDDHWVPGKRQFPYAGTGTWRSFYHNASPP